MNNRGQRKTPPHTPHSHKKRDTPPAPPAHAAQPTFDSKRWQAYWQQQEVPNQQIKEARAILKAQPQNKEALTALRRAVGEKYRILREMYVYQRGNQPPIDDTDSWWSIDPAYELLRGGDVAQLETVIQFLENDPWFHGSGYLKEDITSAIKPGMVSANDAKRLAVVCLSIVDKRDGREFRGYCNLARKVDSPALRNELTRRLTHFDLNIRRRARWMLDALGQPQ